MSHHWRDELAGLPWKPEVESRLVSNGDATGPWPVRFGPFSEQDFARLPKTDWTLLVQAVDLCGVRRWPNFMRILTFCHAGEPMTLWPVTPPRVAVWARISISTMCF